MLGGDESTQVTAGIAGFLVLLGLAVACFFLFRSMNTHLRNLKFSEREQEFRQRSSAAGPSQIDGDANVGHVEHVGQQDAPSDAQTTDVTQRPDDPIGSSRLS